MDSRGRRVLIAGRVIMLALAVRALTVGVSYLPPFAPSKLPAALGFISDQVPLELWAALWLGAGLMAAVGAILARPHYVAPFVGVAAVWGSFWLFSWVRSFASHLDISRDYNTAVQYLALAVIAAAWLSSLRREPPAREE